MLSIIGVRTHYQIRRDYPIRQYWMVTEANWGSWVTKDQIPFHLERYLYLKDNPKQYKGSMVWWRFTFFWEDLIEVVMKDSLG